MLLVDTGKLPEAEASFHRAVAISEQLVRENPAAAPHFELAVALNNMATLRVAQARHAEAVALLERAIIHQKEVVKAQPLNEEARELLRDHLENRAVALADLGQPREALEAAREIIAMGEAVVRSHPQHPSHRRDLADSYHNRAKILKSNGRLAEAESSLRKAIEIGAQLTAEFPHMTEARLHLVVYHHDLGSLLKESTRFPEAREAYQRASPLAEALVRDFPDRPSYREKLAAVLSDLAWLLATCPDSRIRDLAGAVKLAQRATEVDPKNGDAWNTLGVAHYRLGDGDAALRELGKSQELNRGESVNAVRTWLFLAMAHSTKGNKDQARQWYDKAVAWMEKNPAKNDDFVRLRAEAAALLGLTGRPQPPETKKENLPQRSTP